ncbi:ATP-binding protein [Micromonospora sp. NPDC023814]|uniref:ATP-binding protein n=1 Tax=Micromonospora sp. NPDC023814 TaxID=3154596 RepID=UPI0033EDC35B
MRISIITGLALPGAAAAVAVAGGVAYATDDAGRHEPVVQTSTPDASGQRRTGLGLAIVRQIVESHGGHATVFSRPGTGSTFVCWLPATDRTDDDPPPTASPV